MRLSIPMKLFKDSFMIFIEMPSCMQRIAAAAALRTLCLPSIFRLKSKDSLIEVSLKYDFIPSDL